MTTLFGAAFFTLTGFHGAHVIGGLIWLTILLFKAFGLQGGFSAKDNLGVEIFFVHPCQFRRFVDDAVAFL